MILRKLQSVFHPEQYHGWGKTKKFFEGWYYKIVDATETKAFAFIPGIAMDEHGKQQAFLQVLDGKQLRADYFKFDAKEFSPSPGKFDLSLARNHFTAKSFKIDVSEIKGELHFHKQVPWSSSWFSPGIMGPFTFVPFMQCYHGILSMDHTIQGELNIHGEHIDFTGGRGYMEKDWGRSFPSSYIWLQTNHFTKQDISIKASVAKIPWLKSSFVGFIAGVWLYDRLIEFTTYNFTKLRKSYADAERVELIMENRNHSLKILASRTAATGLVSPIQGFMDGRIEESMTSVVHVQLYDKRRKKVLLDDRGTNAGLEVAGKVEEILI